MKKLLLLLLVVLSLSSCRKEPASVTMDLGEVDFGELVNEEDTIVVSAADVATQEEVEALLKDPFTVSKNLILDEQVDFQGDKKPERVLVLRAHPENANLDYAVDLFVYSDAAEPVLLKYDQIYNDSTYGDSYFLAVKPTDLNADGKEELFVNKILRGDNRYYVFGWDGWSFNDFPVPKGYLNLEAYFGPLGEGEICKPKLSNVFVVDDTIQEDYQTLYCGGTQTLYTVTQTFDGKEFTAQVAWTVKNVRQDDLGEFSYHLDPKTNQLSKEGVLVLEEDLREKYAVHPILELSIATQYKDGGSDYVFFQTEGGCEACANIQEEGLKITPFEGGFNVEDFKLENLETIGNKACYSYHDLSLDGKNMLCSNRENVWIYKFPGYDLGVLTAPAQNLSYVGECFGLCEGDLYWRASDSQMAVRVYRDAGTDWANHYALWLYDLNNNLLYEASRLE